MGPEGLNISFDFDATLSRKDVQEYCKELLERGLEIYIVTSRSSSNLSNYLIKGVRISGMNDDLFEVSDNLKINRENIIFTESKDKVEFLNKFENLIFHLDDDSYELEQIEKLKTNKYKGIDVTSKYWKEECELTIKKYLERL